MARPIALHALLALALAMPRSIGACAAPNVCMCNLSFHETQVRSASEILEAKHSVFVGTVRSFARRDSLTVTALVNVTRWWRGAGADTIRVALRNDGRVKTSCDVTLEPGDQYLFLLPDQGLMSTTCNTRPLAEADSLLRILGSGKPPG